MVRRIKNQTDFVLGITMLLVSLYLLFSPDIVKGMTLLYTDITIAKAATYVRILGGLMLLLSGGITLRSLGIFGKDKAEEQRGSIDKFILLFFALLVIYMPLMAWIGFTISSIFVISGFTFIIRAREKQINLRNKQEFIKNLVIAILYGTILVLVLELLFTKGLHVRLP